MEKNEILQNIYNKLRFSGAVRSKQDFAERIGYNYTSTSAAFNGAERYLNNRFFTRILRAFPQVNEEYVRTGEGEILIAVEGDGDGEQQGTGIIPLTERQHGQKVHIDMEKVLAAINEQQELTKRQQVQTEKALDQIDKLIEIIRTMSNLDEKENGK